MKTIVLLAAITSCTTASLPSAVQPIAACAVKATHDTAITLIATVEGDIVLANWEAMLGSLALQWGQDAVTCAVQAIFDKASANVKAGAQDAQTSLKATRAATYLKAHGAS